MGRITLDYTPQHLSDTDLFVRHGAFYTLSHTSTSVRYGPLCVAWGVLHLFTHLNICQIRTSLCGMGCITLDHIPQHLADTDLFVRHGAYYT